MKNNDNPISKMDDEQLVRTIRNLINSIDSPAERLEEMVTFRELLNQIDKNKEIHAETATGRCRVIPTPQHASNRKIIQYEQ